MTRRSTITVALVASLFACSSPIDVPSRVIPEPASTRAAAPTSNPTVTGAVPDSAQQGTTLDVTINGSGFDSGSQASFELNGAVDARVRVNSTRYVKSTQLVANVTIASDAVVSKYDVDVVTATGKKGIGTDAFAVQLANKLPTWTVVDAESMNVSSDNRGDYVSGVCGVDGTIFYANWDPAAGTGGDATFNNNRAGSAGCAARSLTVTFNGVNHNATSFNVKNVLSLNIGDRRTQDFGISIDGDRKCTRVAWHSTADGGAGGQISVTRTGMDSWEAATTGPARCLYYSGTTRIWTTTITNLQVKLLLKQQP